MWIWAHTLRNLSISKVCLKYDLYNYYESILKKTVFKWIFWKVYVLRIVFLQVSFQSNSFVSKKNYKVL
jgi:hypothetical protein